MEEKEEEAWTRFWKARNFRPLPGTSGPQNRWLSRSFRPCHTKAVQECANSLDSPDPAWTFARNFQPCLRAETRAKAHVPVHPSLTPLWLLLYILIPLLHSRVSKVVAHLEIELCSSITDLLHERDCGPSSKKIHLGFKTSSRRRPPSRPPYGEEPVTFVSSFVGFGSCILPLCSSI